MTAEHRAEDLRQLRELISISEQSRKGHVDLQPSRIKRDEVDVMSNDDMLDNN